MTIVARRGARARPHEAHQSPRRRHQRRGARRSLGARAGHRHRRAHRSRAHLQSHDRRDGAVARAHRVPAARRRVAGHGAAARPRDQESAHADPARGAGVPQEVRAATIRAIAQLLDATLEIVEEEVGTLRRLVGNFSNFARLPHAELTEASLADFLRDCETQLGHLEDPSLGEGSADNEPIPAQNVEIRWEVPERGHQGRGRSSDAAARAREPRAQRGAGDPRRARSASRRPARTSTSRATACSVTWW